jgi:hypothetical protein
MKIIYNKGNAQYFDVYGREILAGDEVFLNGRIQVVVRTEDGYLGTDATNPAWIEKGWAVPFEYGVYPFNEEDKPVLVTNTREV